MPQWQLWLAIIAAVIAVAAISVPIIFSILREKQTNKNKERNAAPTFQTVAHYIDRACAYAEVGDRKTRMDISLEKLNRVRNDLNKITCLEAPSPEVARAINCLNIAIGRAMSGLQQWMINDEQKSKWGLEDLQRARALSEEALEILGIPKKR